MKNIKRIILCFLMFTILFTLGGCKSMNIMINKNAICNDAIEYLKQKYSADFEIISARMIIEPAQSSGISIICKDSVYNRPFKVFHGMDSTSLDFDDEEINQELEKLGKANIVDDYGTVILSEKYSENLKTMIGENIFVLCDTEFDDYYPSLKDTNDELETTIDTWKDEAVIKVFVFYEKDDCDSIELINKVSEAVGNYAISMQYVYLCEVDSLDVEKIKNDYCNNWNVYCDYIVDCEYIGRIDEFYMVSDGVAKNIQNVKE